MPLIKSTYKPSFPFRNAHFSTVYSAKLRPSPSLTSLRERLTLKDGDFIDIDWTFAQVSSPKVAIILHGLEGNSQRTYIKAQANILMGNGWNVAALNFRGCSGEPNLSYQSYTAGKTDDLEAVLNMVLAKNRYSEISLVGFSLGGNLLLKYLGERESLPKEIKSAVAISTPLDLKGSLEALNDFSNWIYRNSFLKSLRKKYKEKMNGFPDRMTASEYAKITSLIQFDNIYTAPAHGFKDAEEYYKKNSSLQFLPNISIPIYILNAENDSFLSPNCFPVDMAQKMKNMYLEVPKYGGHVGFHQSNTLYYSERRSLEFLNNVRL